MKHVKIVHCGDIHIGAPFTSMGKNKTIRQKDIVKSFINIVEIADSYDILLIAGDLFDCGKIDSSETIEEIKLAMANCKAKIVISPGNHNPYYTGSNYDTTWPNNVFIFKNNKQEYIEFSDIATRVYGAAFTSGYNDTSMLDVTVELDNNYINIVCMHGDIKEDKTETSVYNPIYKEDIENSHFDYIALGHIHDRTEVCNYSGTSVAYSGCHDSGSFGELGIKGIYIGSIFENGTNLEFKQTSSRIYHKINVDIGDCESYIEVVHKVKEVIKNYNSNNCISLVLVGEVREETIIPINELYAELSYIFYLKIIDKTTVDISSVMISTKSTKGQFLYKLKNELANCENEQYKQTLNLAIKLGLLAMKGSVEYYEDNQY